MKSELCLDLPNCFWSGSWIKYFSFVFFPYRCTYNCISLLIYFEYKKWNEILLSTTVISHGIHSWALLLRSGISFKFASFHQDGALNACRVTGRIFPALAVLRVLGLPSAEQNWQVVLEAIHSHLGCLCCITAHPGCVTGTHCKPASLIPDPRCVAQSRDTGHGFSSARTPWFLRDSVAGHTLCLQELGSWGISLPASGIYLELCDLQLHYKQLLQNRCTKLLVYEKLLLYAGILSGMKWDYFNIGKWMAVSSFNSGKLSPVTYSKLWFPR